MKLGGAFQVDYLAENDLEPEEWNVPERAYQVDCLVGNDLGLEEWHVLEEASQVDCHGEGLLANKPDYQYNLRFQNCLGYVSRQL